MRNGLLVLASVIHVSFRLAYFFYIGLTLKSKYSTEKQPARNSHDEWLRFKRKAAFILNADGLTFGLATVLSAGSLPLQASFAWTLVTGVVLVCAGVAVKVSAYRVLGVRGYYWYNFFCRDDQREYVAKGVYKYLDNPMYTLGYLHAFGFALVFRSMWGLVFALFDVIVLWVFHSYVEKPHTALHRQEVMRIIRPDAKPDSSFKEDYRLH
jgi:protein-S-isoprenylcysteine O-methyltransferase Ste14